MGDHWRVGRKVGRTIYRQLGSEPSDNDPLIGVMDTPELATQAVAAVNGDAVRLDDVVKALREQVESQSSWLWFELGDSALEKVADWIERRFRGGETQ